MRDPLSSPPPLARVFEAVVFWGLAIAVLWAPLPFGSNRPWSWSLLGVWMGILLVLWAVGLACGQTTPSSKLRALLVPCALFGFVVGLVVVQLSCWTPQSWHHPVWRLVETIPAALGCPAVTIDRHATWTALTRLLTYGGAFWLALQVAGVPARAGLLLRLVSLAAAVYAAYGLVLYFAGLEWILWYRKWTQLGYLTGTFVNRNSFASFAGMGAVVNLAIVLHGLLAGHGAPAHDRSLRLRLLAEDAALRFAPYILGFMLTITATVLTSSRAGLAATCLGLVVLTIAMGVHHRTQWRWRTIGAAAVVGLVILVLAAGGRQFLNRFENLAENVADREMVIGRTLEASAEQPWLGVGYGTFEEAWPFYRPAGVNRWFRQAHSTYAENLLELGVFGAAALTLAVAWVIAVCARGVLRRRRDGIYPSVALAAASVPAIHSTIDFSLQIPAITLLFVVLLGVGFRHSFPTGKGPTKIGASAEEGMTATTPPA